WRAAGRRSGHHGPRAAADRLRQDVPAAGRVEPRALALLDPDLRAHGGGAVLPPAGPLPGARVKKLVALAVLARLFPLAMNAIDQQFYLTFATRILIYAMAAASLNLVLGYGGMVSFGHAAFFGAGAYIAGILAVEGITSLWISSPIAIGTAALAAL